MPAKSGTISRMVNPIKVIHRWFQGLPDKKKYIEVVTASLSIPVLLSVVFVNYLNIQDKRKGENPLPIISQEAGPTIITVVRDPTPTPTASNAPSRNECIREIGPITILAPQEGENVTSNPFTIDVKYNQGNYCSVVWRYRLDGGNWSQFGDNDIVIYNLSSGQKKIELEVKSIVTNESETFMRTFTYQNTQEVPTATSTPSPTTLPQS